MGTDIRDIEDNQSINGENKDGSTPCENYCCSCFLFMFVIIYIAMVYVGLEYQIAEGNCSLFLVLCGSVMLGVTLIHMVCILALCNNDRLYCLLIG